MKHRCLELWLYSEKGPLYKFFWTKRLFNLYQLVRNDFKKRKRDAFYSPSIVVRIHIYSNFFSSAEENLYSPVRKISVILGFTGFPVSCYKGLLYFYSLQVWEQKLWISEASLAIRENLKTVTQMTSNFCFKHYIKGRFTNKICLSFKKKQSI